MADSAWLLLLTGPGKPSKRNVLPQCSLNLLTKAIRQVTGKRSKRNKWRTVRKKGQGSRKADISPLPPTPGEDIKHQPWQEQLSRRSLVLGSPGSTLSLRERNCKTFRAGFCSQLSQLSRSSTSPGCSAPHASKTCLICAAIGADVRKPPGYFWWLSSFPA